MQARGAPRVQGTPPPLEQETAEVTCPLPCQIPSSHTIAFALIESASVSDCLHPRLQARYTSCFRQLTPNNTLKQVEDGATCAPDPAASAIATAVPALVRRDANSPEPAFSVPDSPEGTAPDSPASPGSPQPITPAPTMPVSASLRPPPAAQQRPVPNSFRFDSESGFGDNRHSYGYHQGADMPQTAAYRPPTQEQHAHDQRTFQAHHAAQHQRAAQTLQQQRVHNPHTFMSEQTGGEGGHQQPAPNCLEAFGSNHEVTLDALWEDYQDNSIHLASFIVQDSEVPSFPPKFDLHLVELIKDPDTGDLFTTQDGMVAVRFCIVDNSFAPQGPKHIIQWIHLSHLLRVPDHSQLNTIDLLYLYEHLPRPTFPDTRGPLEELLPSVSEHTALPGWFLREQVLTPIGWRSGVRVSQTARAVQFNDLSGGSFSVPFDRSDTTGNTHPGGYIIHKAFTEHVFAWGPFSTNHGYPFTYYFNTLYPTHWLLRDGYTYALHEDYNGDRGWFWAMSGSVIQNWHYIRTLIDNGSARIIPSTATCPVRRGRALNPVQYDPNHALITTARRSSHPRDRHATRNGPSAHPTIAEPSSQLARLASQHQHPRRFSVMKTSANAQPSPDPENDASFGLLVESVTRSFSRADPAMIENVIRQYVANSCGSCDGRTQPHLSARGGYKCSNDCGLHTLSETAVDMISSLALSKVVSDQDEDEEPAVSSQPSPPPRTSRKRDNDEDDSAPGATPTTPTTPTTRSKRRAETRPTTQASPKRSKPGKSSDELSLNKWQTLFPNSPELSKLELKYAETPNCFVFCASNNAYRAAHIPPASLAMGPVKGVFNVLYANSGKALAWGAPPTLLVPYEEKRNFHGTALKVPRGAERARLCKISRSLQSTVANAAPSAKKHRSGHSIPEDGWSDEVIERIVLAYKRIHENGADVDAFDHWSEQHEQSLRRNLRERDFTKFQNDIVDHILSEVLESEEVEAVKATRTKETMFDLLKKLRETYPHLAPEALLGKMCTNLNLQEGRKNPKLTHAHGCEYFNGGPCGSELPPPHTTACLPQLASTTLAIYMSALRNHPGVPLEFVAATKSTAVVARIASYARHQASCGRTVEGCDPLFKPEADAIILWLIESMKEITVNSQTDILELIKTATCVAWLATVRDFARRGAGCLRLKRSQCMVFKTAAGSFVGSIDCKHRKVTKSNPHALCLLDMDDPCSSFVNIMRLQQLYENYGIDIAETFLFPLYIISDGAFILAPPTKSNKLQIHTAATLQPLIDRAAKACQLGKKVSVKSLRSMNTMLGASAGLTEPRLNSLMSWTKTSSQAKSYCNMVRALAVPPASVTAEQLKALEHATCYDIATFAADQGQVWN